MNSISDKLNFYVRYADNNRIDFAGKPRPFTVLIIEKWNYLV